MPLKVRMEPEYNRETGQKKQLRIMPVAKK